MSETRKRIGVYQRPAPPKRPLGLHRPGAVQQPQIPLHAIEAQANALAESIVLHNFYGGGKRKPGRPSVNDRPMTAGERQARRRELQARERGIQEALAIGDDHGKSRGEARSGGYDSTKLATMIGIRATEYLDFGDSEAHVGRRVRPAGGADKQSEHGAEGVHVKGLRYGNEETNRGLFAEEQLGMMVEAYFNCDREHVEMTFACRLCGDSMGSIEDATDHLRVDHRQTIDEWFKRLNPPREFRDMGRYITIAVPRKSEPSLDSAGCERSNITQPGNFQ